MPKVKISEYSATANSNTDVASINIDEGCAPSGINNAIRAVMGHLKDFQQGTYGDPFNGPVNGTLGATTAATANVTTLTTSSTVTHNGGTANGVAYLNGSKVLTTGSALTYDGATLANNAGSTATALSLNSTNATYGLDVPFKYNGTNIGSIGSSKGIDSTGNLTDLGINSAANLDFATSYTRRMRLNSSGTVILQGGSTSATGVGIAFPATQSASSDANTLDDYEEGTFTVTFTCGTSGTITLDSNVNEMSYIKIGSKVTIFGRVIVGSVSSPVGSINMSLPFTSIGSLTDGAGFMGLPMFTHDVNLSANVISLFAEITPGTASALFYQTFDDAAWTALPAANLTGSGPEIFYVTGSYITAS